ncbi:Guanosine-diphosphatase [Neolecta irregularis DAH-3]|uniref:guanosine-diphosphatase n=1 Tax=Neolecta irregularis (strain DAH-3) TaxID=1198029 RepID=A0A1U7LNC0_NEOID|nr:Guanosine-diphosphatase [Neolecta irregularis DAH-3]|eukprot:OLL24166.1 Guanosine-diphosphatase [Neolecta irregularis DAH-3]
MLHKFVENAFFISILVTATLTYAETVFSSKPSLCWNYCKKCNDDNSALTLTTAATQTLEEYILVIDAGSRGSRIHVYRFTVCNGIYRLEDEDFDELKPGLSYYNTRPIEAAKSLDPLLEFAIEKVPQELQDRTPIVVKATAGLRSLNKKESDAILDAVRSRLKNEYPFSIAKDGVGILSGEDEAVYGWITANYLLCRLNSKKPHNTVAAFDLGGTSTEIAFELRPGDERPRNGDKNQITKVATKEDVFTLYENSYSSFGHEEARIKIYEKILKDKGNLNLEMVEHPCIPPGQKKKVSLTIDGDTQDYTFVGPHSSEYKICKLIIESVLQKDSNCQYDNCGFNGLWQPKFDQAFPNGDIYLSHEFHDRIHPLGISSSFKLKKLHPYEKLICSGKAGWNKLNDKLVEMLKDDPEYCMVLMYISLLLERGYEIPKNRQVTVAKRVFGIELGWPLAVALLSFQLAVEFPPE